VWPLDCGYLHISSFVIDCCVYLLGSVPAPEDVSDEIVLANTFLNSLSNPVPAEAPTRGRDRDVKSAGGLRRPRLTWIDDPRRRSTPGKAKVRQGVCGGAMCGEWRAFSQCMGLCGMLRDVCPVRPHYCHEGQSSDRKVVGGGGLLHALWVV
jgi:hypothetical protein